MIADDEPFVRNGLEKLIPWQDLGYELKGTYRNGKLLLEDIPNQCPDLIILDIHMPIMGGLETSRIIAEQYPKIVIILLTAYAEFSYAQEAIKYGVRGYVLKSNLLEDIPKELKAMTNVLEQIEQQRIMNRKTQGIHGEDGEDIEETDMKEDELELPYNEQIILEIRQYVLEHLSEKLTLNDIAEATHMNKSYLSRIFKQKTGENLFEMINRLRIEKAKEYIKQGNKRMYEVGYHIGIDDTAYFSRLFKKYEGCSPKEFENRIMRGKSQ